MRVNQKQKRKSQHDMKIGERNDSKALYQKMRKLPFTLLWEQEVPMMNAVPVSERIDHLGLIRAVGVVCSESGTPTQKNQVRQWLRQLLKDPSTRVRRYAMNALPKLESGSEEERDLLALLKSTADASEKKAILETLEKIGGKETLQVLDNSPGITNLRTQQKITASVARNETPGVLLRHAKVEALHSLKIHLRNRKGFETCIRKELEASFGSAAKFRIDSTSQGCVAVFPKEPFSIQDLYSMRCFATVGFVLGGFEGLADRSNINQLAKVIASPRTARLMKTMTAGPIRYRLNFVFSGHQRATVQELAEKIFSLNPDLINDPSQAPWTINIFSNDRSTLVELSPKLAPDPRFAYRDDDVPAASHPTVAACLARLAGKLENEIVWDPFCGSGLELIERSLLGGVVEVFGTDLSEQAIAISKKNFELARIPKVRTTFLNSDFRSLPKLAGGPSGKVSLIMTNPPMGKRVPIPNLRGLIDDLFKVSETVLKPGGRLVLVNPFRTSKAPGSFKLEFQEPVDLGGLKGWLERFSKK
jgi:23S rRNA G2445 N2-methylase RlmL